MSTASGASGPRAISSNSIITATPSGSFSQKFVRLCRAGGVHDEDNAAPLCLGEPLLDFSSEVIANRGANFMGADRGDLLGCALRRDRADRQDLGCRSDNGGERGQPLGMDARILDVRHSAIFSRRFGVEAENYLALSVKST